MQKRKTLLFAALASCFRHEIYFHNQRHDNFLALLMCSAGLGICVVTVMILYRSICHWGIVAGQWLEACSAYSIPEGHRS